MGTGGRKARAAVQDLAEDLLKLYAQRQMKRGHAFAPDNEWQQELEAAFPYLETEDQLRAIHDVKKTVRHCKVCSNLSDGDVCAVCAQDGRDRSRVLVARQPRKDARTGAKASGST